MDHQNSPDPARPFVVAPAPGGSGLTSHYARFYLLEATDFAVLKSGRKSRAVRQVSVMERGSIVGTFNTYAEASAWCESQESR